MLPERPKIMDCSKYAMQFITHCQKNLLKRGFIATKELLCFLFQTREWCRIKYQSCFPGRNSRTRLEEETPAPVALPPPTNDIDAMFENYKEEQAEVKKAQAEWYAKHRN